MTLSAFNGLESAAAEKLLRDCCGSTAWVSAVEAGRPYQSVPQIQRAGEEIWSSLDTNDWLQAFAAHPKIGEQKAAAKWSSAEQSGMSSASEDTAHAIRALNEAYAQKFGWIFIVCATGKSGEEMRASLEARLGNPQDVELALAASEQLKITHLRLAKLFNG